MHPRKTMSGGPLGSPHVILQFPVHLDYRFSTGCSKFLRTLHACMCHAVESLSMVRMDGSVIADQLSGCSITHTMLHKPTLPLYGGCKGRLISQECIVKITDTGYVGSGDLHGTCK